MFKNLLSFWKGKDFLCDVLSEFEKMLLEGEEMFKGVRDKLLEGKPCEGLREKIYAMDRKINALEKDIRRKIVEHLALQPAVAVPMCLILMSVVKDAERIGDYAKNLFEVSEMLEEPLNKELFQTYFNGTDQELILLAEKTRGAFIKSDEAMARENIVLEREIVVKCEKAIRKLASGNESANLSVCLALIARYLKRTAVHLVNIGTSVVVPINELDFLDELERSKKIN